MMERRADFIWLGDQKVDHLAGFTTFRGTPTRREDEGTNRWIVARRTFPLDRVPTKAIVSITVDGRYKLWINGQRIGSGPVRASPRFQRVDEHDVASALRPGENVAAVLIHVPGVDLAWYETMKGGWQPGFGDGGLYFHLEDEAGATLVASDERWRMVETNAWSRDTLQAGWGQDFVEEFDATHLGDGWTKSGFEDSKWPWAQRMVSIGGADQEAKGWGRVEPFPILIRSEIPAPAESELRPSRLMWVRPCRPCSDLPLERRLYEEELDQPDASLASGADALIEGKGPMVVRTRPDRDTSLLFAFDPYHAGRPFFEIEAKGGEVIEIACGEALPGEFGRGEATEGLGKDGLLGCASLFRYTARPGRQRFEKFGWTAVRAMQLVVRNAQDGLRFHDLGSLASHFPAEPLGSFECSDPLLTELWQVARHTLLQCMHDSWIDCPGREARQWVGDAVVEFDAAARAFGPSIFPLQRQFLLHAAEGQRADGLLRMVAPGDIGPDAITIPDYSLLYVLAAERYWLQSGDKATIEAIIPTVERILAWFDRLRGSSVLVANVPEWHFIEWADLGRSGWSAPINALLAGAFAAAARLSISCGRPGAARSFRAQARRIGRALNTSHWDRRRGLYVDSVDPTTGSQSPRASQHANALMLLFGLAPRGRADRLIRAITNVDRLKLTAAPPIVPEGEPFDEETDIVRANTFFAHFVHDGLARAGRFDWVTAELRRGYGPMLAAGATTLWESYQAAASLCHGFSATPLYQLSAHALGVSPLAPSFARFAVAPQSAGLEWARGSVPTVHGPIQVEWQIEQGRLEARVRHPVSCRPEPAAPRGYRLAETRAATGEISLSYEPFGEKI